MKCHCKFQIKVMVSLGKKKCSKKSNNSIDAIMFVHTKYNEYHLGIEVDKMFLPIHPLVISFVMENLKHMISISTITLMSI